MLDIEKEIKKILKRERKAYLPKWVKPDEVDNLILENFIVYILNNELISFVRVDFYDDENLELDWGWIKDKEKERFDWYYFFFWVFNQLFKYSERVYSNFFEHIDSPLVRFSKRKNKRYLTAYRFNPVAFNPEEFPHLNWNGIYAYTDLKNSYVGYSKIAYNLYLETGVPFLVLDLPAPPPGRDFQVYYEVEIDREKALEKFQRISRKHKKLKGEVRLVNFKLFPLTSLVGD